MKKAIKFIFAILAIFFAFSGCQSIQVPNESVKKTDTPPPVEDAIMLSLKDAAPKIPEGISDVQLGFNLALLKKFGELEGGNLFYSPMSINAAMTMTYFGANGQTRQEIADALGYGDMDIEDVAAYQKYLLQSYENSGDTTFTTANSIWIDDAFELKQSYINTMLDVFETQVTRLDLTASDAIDTLNSWIDKSTNHMIDTLFEKEDNPFDATTVMVLLNAIYFDGGWTTPFNMERTYDALFNGKTKEADVKMMVSTEPVMGHKADDYISVRLPYGEDKRFQMVAVIPEDIEAFIDSLTAESLNALLNTFGEQGAPTVQIPIFEMEQKVKLNDALIALGIEQAFSGAADFSGMSEEEIYIDEVLHKTRIKVDEEGTEAAAATSVEMKLRGVTPENRFEFIADKPFLFFIVDTENDMVLFTGKVLDLN